MMRSALTRVTTTAGHRVAADRRLTGAATSIARPIKDNTRGRTSRQSPGTLKAAMGARGLRGPAVLQPLLTLDDSTGSAIVAEVAALGESPARPPTLSES